MVAAVAAVAAALPVGPLLQAQEGRLLVASLPPLSLPPRSSSALLLPLLLLLAALLCCSLCLAAPAPSEGCERRSVWGGALQGLLFDAMFSELYVT